MKERIKRIWRYMMRDKVDLAMFICCIAAVVQHQIWGHDFTDGFAVLAFYVFAVMHRMGVITDLFRAKEELPEMFWQRLKGYVSRAPSHDPEEMDMILKVCEKKIIGKGE